MVSASCWSSPATVAPMSTAMSRWARRAASAKETGGVLAPRSMTSKPAPRRMSARMALGKACVSPATDPTSTAPGLRPRRANSGPSRPMSRAATVEA